MNLEFDRKNGLEIGDERWSSWEGRMRIMPEFNYSLIDKILEVLESQNCEAAILKVELMLLLEIKFSSNAPLRTSQLQENVIKRVLKDV